MQKILEKIELDYYEENWKSYLKDIYKPDEIVYNILKLADAYSVYQWCINEKTLGNYSSCITDIYFDSCKRIEKYTDIINKLIEEENK